MSTAFRFKRAVVFVWIVRRSEGGCALLFESVLDTVGRRDPPPAVSIQNFQAIDVPALVMPSCEKRSHIACVFNHRKTKNKQLCTLLVPFKDTLLVSSVVSKK